MVRLLFQMTRCSQPTVTILQTMPLILFLSQCYDQALVYLSWHMQCVPYTKS